MKKLNLLLIFLGMILSNKSFAQIGINTENPKGVFHIDAGKDNPAAPNDPDTAQQLNDIVVTPIGNIGIGTINPSSKLEVTSGSSGISGIKMTNLPNASGLATDANGNIIMAGVLTAKQKLTTANSSVEINSPDGLYSFRYSSSSIGGYWQIKNNSSGGSSVSTFVTEFWTPSGYAVNNSSASLSPSVWSNIPGSTTVGVTNELNIFRIYDNTTGITYRLEGNLLNISGLKMAMLLEQF